MKINAKVAGVPYLVWMIIFIVLPLLLVGYYAFTNIDGGFTLNNVVAVGRDYLPTFARSIWMALVATVVCLVLAFPMAYFISRLRAVRQSLMIMLIMLPMWINFLIRTYALGNVLKWFGIFGTQGAVIIGMVYDFLPFMILPLYSVMTKIDNSIIDAAKDLGASRIKVATKILIPLSVPGITTGITMVFVPSLSTFAISQLLGDNKVALIGDAIEQQIMGVGANRNLGSAIALVLMVIVLVCMSMANTFDEEMEGMLI